MSEKTIGWLSTHEEWRDIKGYEGLYQVSSFGRVRSLDRIVNCNNGRIIHLQGKIMKAQKESSGYIHIVLQDRSRDKPDNRRIHRLVAEAFLSNPHKYTQVNHKDEKKENNNVMNLEWCSPKYNTNYGNRTLKEAALRSPDTLVCFDPYQQKIRKFSSPFDAASQLSISQKAISSSLRKDRPNHNGAYGYVFMYGNDYSIEEVKRRYEQLKIKPIRAIDRNGDVVAIARSQNGIASKCNVPNYVVRRILNNERREKYVNDITFSYLEFKINKKEV